MRLANQRHKYWANLSDSIKDEMQEERETNAKKAQELPMLRCDACVQRLHAM